VFWTHPSTLLWRDRPSLRDYSPEVLPRIEVPQLCVQSAKCVNLLFQVFEDCAVHPGPQLLRALPVACVVREPAARRLERTRVPVATPCEYGKTAPPCETELTPFYERVKRKDSPYTSDRTSEHPMTEASSEPIHPLEKGDVLRKVQRTGVASLTISLPKWWVELVGVRPGDALRFHDLGNGRLELCAETIAVHPTHSNERGLTIDARGATPHLVPRLIVGAYVTGLDQVTITGRLTPLERDEIDPAIAKLLGASIVEDGPDQVVIQTFIDPARYSIARLLDRLVHLLLEQVDECLRGALGTGASDRSQLVALEDEMDKIYRLTVRQLMLACGHDDVAKEIGAAHHHSHMRFRMIAKLLEDLGDHLFSLGKNLFPEQGGRWNVPEDVAKEVALRLERFGTLLRRTVSAFESPSAEEANLVLNDVRSDVPVLMALTRNLPGRVSSQPDSRAVGRVLEYLLSLTQMLNVMNEVTINQAVDLEELSRHDARFSQYSVEPRPGG